MLWYDLGYLHALLQRMSRGKMKKRTTFARAFKQCTNKKNADKVAVFDVDKDEIDYVNMYDPGSSHHRSKMSKEQQREPPVEDFINIADDEGNIDLNNENIASNGTSRDFHQPSSSYRPFFDIEDDECQMIFEKGKKPVDLANGMSSGANSSRIFPSCRRFSVNNSTRIYFKHGTSESDMYISDSSEEDFSESEDSDCEIINDSSGIESWERAAKKKRKQDQTTDSESNSTASESIEESSIPFCEKKSEKHNVGESSCQKHVDYSNLKYAETVHSAFETSKNNLTSDDMGSFAVCSDDITTQWSNATPVFSVTGDANSQAHNMLQKDNIFAHCDASLRHSLDKAPTISTLNREQSSLFEATAERVHGFSYSDLKLDSGLVDPIPESENSLMGEREKHKESEEYKRAAEAEWASRQEELRIQAEEAQRLRKRKKAENLRLLEMEKRQKQRLEEVRESQKKVEETDNLKEKIRTDVRNELAKMEFLYHDMPSLLRALGVSVGGGYFPSSQEVHTAYKRAALRFHPDRASRTDIRQQVEAEEKFKLISRMKDKLLPGTW